MNTKQAKAKAEKIIEMFSDNGLRNWSPAKQCALICCDEIIEELRQLRKPEYTTFIIRYTTWKKGTTEVLDEGESCDGYEKIEFWQSVHSEIVKL